MNQQKNGLPEACCRLCQSEDAADVSSSDRFMRILVGATVSSMVCLQTLAEVRRYKAGSSDL